MIEKRIFKKFFNRSMPLFSVEYWYKGENDGLCQLVEGVMHFNPLFIYKKGRGIDIYYDINNLETDDELLISYFQNKPNAFEKIAREYKWECDRLLQLSKSVSSTDIGEILDLHISFFSKLTIIVLLGRLAKNNDSRSIFQLAYDLRYQTDRVEYISHNNLLKLLNQSLSDNLREYINILLLSEVLGKEMPNTEVLKNRKNGYIYFEGKLYTNFDIQKLEEQENIKIEKEDDSVTGNILKGNIAMIGKVRGRARVVFECGQLDKVREGDILITAMTTPDYISAMKKAAAFVTDEGGITCHAAIIAREMKKPCIIGTKNATKVLKDDDEVEVDADNGIVKIIKKA